MAKRKQSDIERDQARSQVSDWESQNGSLDDNQRATLQRMIELNSNTAEQDIRRADYYNGGSSKYDKDTQDVKVRNDNTGRLVTKKKDIFSLKDGSEEPSLYDIYHNNEFDKNNRNNNVGINRVTNMLSQNRDTTGTTPVTPTSGPAFTTDNTSAARDRGGILGFLDRTLGRFSKAATDVFFPGAVDQQYEQLKKEGKDNPIWRESTSAPDNGFEKAADVAGTVFGYTAPVGASYKAVSKPIQLLTKGKELSTLGKVGVEALRGSSAGGVLGAGESVRDELANPDENNMQDHLKHIGTNALIGGIGDPAVMGVGKGLGKALQAVNKEKAFKQLETVVGDKNVPLETKVDYVPTSARNEVNVDDVYNTVMKRPNSNSVFDNLIQNAKKTEDVQPKNLSESISSLKAPQGNLEDALQSIAKPKESPSTKLDNPHVQEYEDAVTKQYNYLKSSMGKGVEPGGLIRDELGDVVGRYGRISNNPSWYQEFYKANGRKPNNTELRKLAEEHVRNGYNENGVDIPSWSPSTVKHLDDQIEQMNKMVSENPTDKEALAPILDALHQERKTGIEQFYKDMNGKGSSSLPEGVQAMRSAEPIIPNPTQQVEPITHQELLQGIKKDLGVTIRTGRMGVGQDVQGIYKQTPEVIRTKKYGDLDTIAHEVGHEFDKKFGLSQPQFDNELMSLGKGTSGEGYTPEQIRQEGIAEFMRRYLIDPRQAYEAAPKFSQHFESVIPDKVKNGISNTQNNLSRWYGQTDAQRDIGRIARYQKPTLMDAINNIKENASDKFYTAMVDKLHPLSKAEKELSGGTLPSAESSAYKQARLSVGAPRIAEEQSKELKGIIDELQKQGNSMDELVNYATMKHAKNLQDKGIETGFSEKGVQDIINQYKDNPAMDKAQKALVKFNDNLLQRLVDAQVVSEDAAKAMREKHTDYVPFMRHFDESADDVSVVKNFVDLNNPVKKLEGSDRNVINPLESMVKNTFKMIDIAEKNKVGLQLAEMAKKEGAAKYIERLEGKQPVSKENIVTVFENGEKVQYQLSDELYKTMKSLEKEQSNALVNAMAKGTNVLRIGATTTPEFGLRNIARDQAHAYVVSKTRYNPLTDLPKGLKEVVNALKGNPSETYKQWIEKGGAFGGIQSMDRDLLSEQLKEMAKNDTKKMKVFKSIVDPREWYKRLETLAQLSEEATKVGAYKKGLAKGLSPEEAAFQARELMDFNRSGNVGQTLNKAYAFLNANIQGKDVLIRALKENPVRTIARATGVTVPPTVLSMMTYEMSDDDTKQRIDNLPKWQKEAFWLVPIPFTEEVARIPKPFDLIYPANKAEEMYNKYVRGKEEIPTETEFIKEAASVLSPTAIKPLMEAGANYSFFKDAPIVSQRDQKNSQGMQYTATTSPTAVELGKLTGVSPQKLDYIYKGYTAGLGQLAKDPVDAATRFMRNALGKEEDKYPTQAERKFTEATPLVRGFFADTRGGGQTLTDYYNVMSKQEQIQADAEDNGQDAPNKAEMKEFKKVNEEMAKLRKSYKGIQEDTSMDPKTKREQLDALDKEMQFVARKGIQVFKPNYK